MVLSAKAQSLAAHVAAALGEEPNRVWSLIISALHQQNPIEADRL